METYLIRQCHPVPVVYPVYLLESGSGELADILRDLDPRDYLTVIILHGYELVHPVEDRVAVGCYEIVAYAETVDHRTLFQQIAYQPFVEGVGDDYLTSGETCLVQHLPGLLGEECQVAGIQAYGAFVDVELLEHPYGVRYPALERVVCIHQYSGVVRIQCAECLERIVFRGEHLHP